MPPPSPPPFMRPPPPTSFARLSYPAPHVLLVTLARPASLNCVDLAGHWELDGVWAWLDREPALRVAVVTGEGRAFCAGADLKEWNTNNTTGDRRAMPPSGFGGLSRRGGTKPVIAAVNGIAYGGGCEMVVNCDLVVAAARAAFAFPEVKVGVVAIAGALPRLVRSVGKQRAMEMALTGRAVGAAEAKAWGIVNEVCGEGEGVVERALALAASITANSPDAVIVSREGIKLGWEGVGAEDGTRILNEVWGRRLHEGENCAEGVRAFVEKRKPRWVDSKL